MNILKLLIMTNVCNSVLFLFQALAGDGDILGCDVFQFKTPKKSGSMAFKGNHK